MKSTLFFLCLLLIASIIKVDAQISTWRKQLTGAGLTIGLNPQNPHTIIAEGESDSLYFSFNDGRTWEKRTPPGLDFIRQILVHPTDTNIILIAAGSGGLKRSTNYGLTWQTVISTLGIDGESIDYDTQHPDTMYAANFNEGLIYRSTNKGATWSSRGQAGPLLCAFAVRPDSGNILLAGTSGGTISKSTDAGTTWKVVKQGAAPQEVPKFVTNPVHPLIAYATTYGPTDSILYVWKTTDGGDSWFKTGLQKVQTWAMELDKTNPDILYVGSFSVSKTNLYKSTDAGNTWRALTSPYFSSASMWSLKLHPLQPGTLWLGMTRGAFETNGIYRFASTNTVIEGAVLNEATGDTVKNGYIIIPANHDSVSLNETGGKYQIGFFESDSIAPTATIAAYPYYIRQEQVTFHEDSTVEHTLLLSRLPRLSLSGEIHERISSAPASAQVLLKYSTLVGDSIVITQADSSLGFRIDSLYIEYPPILRYTEIIVNPVLPFAQISILPPNIFSTPVILLDTADVMIFSDSGSGNYLSYYISTCTQLGVATNVWERKGRGMPDASGISFLTKKAVIFPYGTKSDSMTSEVGSFLTTVLEQGSNIFFTGQNFVEKNVQSPLLSNYLGVSFNKNTTYAIGKGAPGDLFNGLQFFTTGPGGASNQTSRDDLLFDSTKGKAVLWYGPNLSNGIAAVRIDSIVSGSRAIVMGFGFEAIIPDTMRRHILKKILSYFEGNRVLDVGSSVENAFPHTLNLGQNYPNPFNPVTTILYSLPTKSVVSVTIYDLLGREVSTLLNAEQEAGEQTLEFDGNALAGGMYFYRLLVTPTSGKQEAISLVKKMLLVK